MSCPYYYSVPFFLQIGLLPRRESASDFRRRKSQNSDPISHCFSSTQMNLSQRNEMRRRLSLPSQERCETFLLVKVFIYFEEQHTFFIDYMHVILLHRALQHMGLTVSPFLFRTWHNEGKININVAQ